MIYLILSGISAFFGKVVDGKVVDAHGNVIGAYQDGKAVDLDGKELGRVEQNELLSCRLRPQGAGQAAGAKREGSGEKMAAIKMWVVHV